MKLVFAMPHLLELPALNQPWELTVTGAEQTRLAQLADRLGYDMLATPEHFAIPNSHVELSGAHYFHAGAAQSYYAGATERITVNSCIWLLPLQHPVVAAKALSTLDWLSSGRAMVTFGVGWLAAEFDLLDVPFHERGRIADEYLAAIIELWTRDQPEFDGKYVSFRDIAFAPKPLQQPHLPIWIGGDADAALRRAARFATGWWPFLTAPDQIARRVEFILSQPEYDGRPFDVMYALGTSRVGEGHRPGDSDAPVFGSTQHAIDALNELAGMGVTYTSVPTPPLPSLAAYEEFVHWVIEEVKPHLPTNPSATAGSVPLRPRSPEKGSNR